MASLGERERDVLPLPTGALLRQALFGTSPAAVSQSQARRGRRREGWFRDLERGVHALNDLGGLGRAAPKTVSACQRKSIVHLAGAFSSIPEHDSIYDPLRAWHMLQGQRPGYTDSVVDDTRPSYQPASVSLPREGAGNVKLIGILPPRLQSQLKEGHTLLRDPEERAAILEELGPAQAMDPARACRGFWFGSLLAELFNCGIIEHCAPTQAVAGIYFVK